MRFTLLIGLIITLFSRVPSSVLPASGETTKPLKTIGILACLRHYEPAPALDKYATLDADLMLWMGDNIYADTDSMLQLKQDYLQLAELEAFQAISHIPTMATWDDHDLGQDSAGAHYPKRDESKTIFMDFWGFPDAPQVRSQPGVYSAQIFGPVGKRVQVIMLDTRYANSDTRVLDEQQWLWLAQQLDKASEFRLIVSSQQILLPSGTRFEGWADVPTEQDRLFSLLRQKKTSGLIFISGDQHFAETSQRNDLLSYPVHEWTHAGINQDEDHLPNLYRTQVAHAKHSYASITFQWSEDPSATFTVRDLEENIILTHTLRLSEISH